MRDATRRDVTRKIATRRIAHWSLLALFALPSLGACSDPDLSARCLTDNDCNQDELCMISRGVCYPAVRPPTLHNQVKGTFSCKRVPSPTGMASGGKFNIDLAFQGVSYALSGECEVAASTKYGKDAYFWMALTGLDLDKKKSLSVQIYWPKTANKIGILKPPKEAIGSLVTGNLQALDTWAAVMSSGTMNLTKVAAQDGAFFEGSLDAGFSPFEKRGHGEPCTLAWPDDSSPIVMNMAKECDDVRLSYCLGLKEGSQAGVCTKSCTKDSDCEAYTPKSRCLLFSSGTSGMCLKPCTKASDCTAPLTCQKNGYCL